MRNWLPLTIGKRFFSIACFCLFFLSISVASDLRILEDLHADIIQKIKNSSITDEEIISHINLCEPSLQTELLNHQNGFDDRTLLSYSATQTGRLELFKYLYQNNARLEYGFKNSIMKIIPYFSTTNQPQALNPDFIPVFYKVIAQEDSKEAADMFISFLFARIELNALREERDGKPEYFCYLDNKNIVDEFVWSHGSIIRTSIGGNIFQSYNREFPEILMGRQLTPGNLKSRLLLPLFESYKQEEIFLRFRALKPIGAGGESTAYAVEDKETGSKYALVINRRRIRNKESNKELVHQLIANQPLNPHQATIYGYFFIEHPEPCSDDYINPFKKWDGEEVFINFPVSNHMKTSVYECYLLTLGIADLTSDSYREIDLDRRIARLFIILSPYFLDMASIGHRDDKLRNYIFVKTEDQTYLSHQLRDYDYICYTIGHHKLYVPVPQYLILRIDYGDWRIRNQNDNDISNRISRLEEYLDREGIADSFNIPENLDAKVLSIMSWQD